MTVETIINKSGPYVLDGATIIFERDFRIEDGSHLRAIRFNEDGTEDDVSPLISAQSGIGEDEGTATISPALTGGSVMLVRAVPNVQETDYNNQGRVMPETVERDIDLAVMQIQDLKERVDRTFRLPVSETPTEDEMNALSAAAKALADNIGSVVTVAGIAPDVVEAAGISSDISTVAENISGILAASGSVMSFREFSVVATEGQTKFTLPASVSSSLSVWVYLNGARQRPGVDFTATGVELTFALPLAAGDTVDGLIVTAVSMQDVETARDEAEAARIRAEAAAADAVNNAPFVVKDFTTFDDNENLEVDARYYIKQGFALDTLPPSAPYYHGETTSGVKYLAETGTWGANVKAFGAKLDGISEDSEAIQSAIDAMFHDYGGGSVFIPGMARTSQPLMWRTGVSLRGYNPTRGTGSLVSGIISDTSDLIHHGTSGYHGGDMSGLRLVSELGGGHIFNVIDSGQSRTHIHNVGLYQRNADKCILHSDLPPLAESGAGYFGNWWDHFNAEYHPENEVAAFLIAGGGTINQNTFSRARIGRPAISKGGTYCFDIHNKTGSSYSGQIDISDITFQQPGGGAVRMRGLRDSGISRCGVWDLTAGSSNPLFYFGVGDGGHGNISVSMDKINSNVRGYDASSVDVYYEQSDDTDNRQMSISDSFIGQLSGNDTSGRRTGVMVVRSSINNVTDICTTVLGSRGEINRVQPGAMVNSFYESIGRPGSFDGYMRWLLNGTYIGGMSSGGQLIWGGTPTSPNARILPDGKIYGTEYRVNGTKVVGARQPAITDATAGTEVATINAILAALRAHGLITT